MLSKEQLKEIKSLASLYVSAHNTQPAQWTYAKGVWTLTDVSSRRLPVADPSGKDHLISLGSSLEALNISLSKYNFKLQKTHVEYSPKLEASYEMKACGGPDPLLAYVQQRKSYRGVFKKPTNEEVNKLINYFSNDPNVMLIIDPKSIKKIAIDFDKANYYFLSQKKYLSELYSWLRFNKKVPEFFEDGLNPNSMSLNSFEALGAKCVLSPKMFSVLKQFKLASVLVSEKSKICSATCIAFIVAPKDMDLTDQGRLFYRKWLEFTRIGYSLNPLSSLIDMPSTYSSYQKKLCINNNQLIVNAFRAGPTPKILPGRYRRPVDAVFKESL